MSKHRVSTSITYFSFVSLSTLLSPSWLMLLRSASIIKIHLSGCRCCICGASKEEKAIKKDENGVRLAHCMARKRESDGREPTSLHTRSMTCFPRLPATREASSMHACQEQSFSVSMLIAKKEATDYTQRLSCAVVSCAREQEAVAESVTIPSVTSRSSRSPCLSGPLVASNMAPKSCCR